MKGMTMTNIVLLGGNGYLGRNVTRKWLEKDPQATFYVVSRSGKNTLEDSRIINIQADVTDYDDVISKLPDTIDRIADFVGRPESDPEKFRKVNDEPAEVMLAIARNKKVPAMGFISGATGPKPFVRGKAHLARMLKDSGIPTVVVTPTIVYGNGRSDTISKFVPLLKFFGIFSKNLKPVHVDDVAEQLVSGLAE